MGNNIVIIAPAFTLSKAILETLKSELGDASTINVVETATYTSEFLRQHFQTQSFLPSHLNLVILNSLTGLTGDNVKLMSHTDKIYYFVVNYSRSTLEKIVSTAGSSDDDKFDALKESMYQGGANDKIINIETLEQYVAEEIKLIEEGKALVTLKKQCRNVEEINGANFEKELLDLISWAKIRLEPAVVAKQASPQVAATTAPIIQ